MRYLNTRRFAIRVVAEENIDRCRALQLKQVILVRLELGSQRIDVSLQWLTFWKIWLKGPHVVLE